MNSYNLDSVNALDPNSLGGLKRLSKDNSPEAIDAAAKQFEALFMQMVLKAMRDATPKDGLTDNDQSRMYQSLLDQQLAIELAKAGGTGFGDMLSRQLGGTGGQQLKQSAETPLSVLGTDVASDARRAARVAALQAATSAALNDMNALAGGSADGSAELDGLPPEFANFVQQNQPPDGAERFIHKHWQDAVRVGKETGIPAAFLIAQAALETGWGKSVLKHGDGTSSNNLFNIKAGSRWDGNVVNVNAVEYRAGRQVLEASSFRSYPNIAASFQDYARFIKGNPRYSEVLNQRDPAGFAVALQRAGYATDPNYASKLKNIISGVENRLR